MIIKIEPSPHINFGDLVIDKNNFGVILDDKNLSPIRLMRDKNGVSSVWASNLKKIDFEEALKFLINQKI